MDRPLRLGYSPCPNDTFIFYAMAERRIDVGPHGFEVFLADVEVLNQMARRRELDITKVSIHAIVHLLDEYRLLRAGGALGRGCGPLVVAREDGTMSSFRDRSIAIPGKLTTANLLLQLEGTHRGRCVEMRFDEIMPAVAAGKVDAGVVIHEGRFTYPSLGLRLVLDLGAWWEKETGLPLPLGGILIKRDLGPDTARQVEETIRRSLLYARSNLGEAWPYIRGHAQEMDTRIIQRHIDMFVNDFSLHMGQEGERAIVYMLEAACRQEGRPLPGTPFF